MRRLPPMFSALKHRNYRLWATADLISVTGTWMQVLGLNWLILQLTSSATHVGFAILLQAVPALMFGLWGGAIADRVPARPLLLVTQTGHALLAAALAVIAYRHDDSVLPVYAVAFVSGVVGSLEGPALGRFGAEIVGREDLGNALALGSIINSSGRILGMSLAGALVPLTGTGALFLLNALSFGAVLAAILAVRTDQLHRIARPARHQRGIVAGLRYLRAMPRLLVLFALGFTLSSLGRNYQVTMAAMSEGPLGAGAPGYGLLSVVFAVGTVAGGVLAAARKRLTVRLLLVMAAVTSMLQLMSGAAPGLAMFALLMFPIAAGAVIIDTTMGTRVQLDSAEHMRGRVIAVHGLVASAAGAVGGPALGWLCDRFGPRQALELAGLTTACASVLAAFALARLSDRPLLSLVRLTGSGRWRPPVANGRTGPVVPLGSAIPRPRRGTPVESVVPDHEQVG
ncbi:Arabinose efflux permease family protein [Carbonactinospora thermoautotrophica]|uniref:Arabinose efflux permease family protein n=2 Tax=Carbonactinospora thermoautotrophica TaxID=1469144 RepID=A0A132MUI1_9ACTN|nr:MFS transporter [Carbonactinospora thermoautotrophica]KWX01511.1 Arabinose efflux permease family protein [Carbonactinospora thermoautotrophica]